MRIPTGASLILGLVGTGAWVILMVISIAFVIYDQPLSFADDKFLVDLMIKYYPLIMGALFLVAIKFKDEKGLIPFASIVVPSLLLIHLIYDMNRLSIIDWDNFETSAQKQFIYESAFGSSKSLEGLFPKVQTVNFTGKVGLTPLLAAYKGRNQETFQYLLTKGANVNLLPQGSLNYNVANYIISDFEQDRRSRDYFEELLKFGLDIHIGTKLSNLLQSSVKSQSQWYMKHLLENGADANRKGSAFLTPIGAATLHEKWESAYYLLPFSDQNSLEEAAAILYENNERGRYWNENNTRESFKQALIDQGINLIAAFEKRNEERRKRLDKIQTKGK